MPFTASSKVRGGKRLEAAIRKGLQAQGVDELRVGFFKQARYQDGTYVAAVAATNEFGSRRKGVPERPFFRRAMAKSEKTVENLVEARVDPKTLVVTPGLSDLIGLVLQGAIQQEITDLKQPPNSPRTIRRKGSSNPLIDIGYMRMSVTWASGHDAPQPTPPPPPRA